METLKPSEYELIHWETKLNNTFQAIAEKSMGRDDWPWKMDSRVISKWMGTQVTKKVDSIIESEAKDIVNLRKDLQAKNERVERRISDIQKQQRALKAKLSQATNLVLKCQRVLSNISKKTNYDEEDDEFLKSQISDIFKDAQKILNPSIFIKEGDTLRADYHRICYS